MKYKNIKTGAIIDTSSKIIGKAWKLIEEESLKKQAGKVISGDEEVPSTDEYVEEEVNLEEMTNKELEEFAEEHDVQLSSDDKKNKSTRIDAIAKAFE